MLESSGKWEGDRRGDRNVDEGIEEMDVHKEKEEL